MSERLQQIYNTVRDHLLGQVVRSKNEGGACLYRGPTVQRNGSDLRLKCAAGSLIPDDVYHPTMESKRPSSLEFFQKNYPNELAFIEELQAIHDYIKPPHWQDLLKELARKHKLKE